MNEVPAANSLTHPVSDLVQLAADRLWKAEAIRLPCAPVQKLFAAPTLQLAYAVQDANTRRRLATGSRIIGRKIGLTSAAVRAQLGVSSPDFGVIHSGSVHVSGDELHHGDFICPRVEGEIAFIVGRRIEPGASIVEIMGAVEAVAPAFEVVDSRMNWDVSAFDSIADNACYGRAVIGSPVRLSAAHDLRSHGMTIVRNGTACSFGTGYASMGSPLVALRHVLAHLGEAGECIEAGEVILSGALGPLVDASAGDAFELDMGLLGRASVRFVQ